MAAQACFYQHRSPLSLAALSAQASLWVPTTLLTSIIHPAYKTGAAPGEEKGKSRVTMSLDYGAVSIYGPG